MTLLLFLPFFLSIFFCFYTSPQKTFLSLYIPFFLLTPAVPYIFDLPGLHGISLFDLVIVPIFFTFLFSNSFKRGMSNWRFSLTELLVILFYCVCLYSEKINQTSQDKLGGGSLVIGLAVSMLTRIVFPYLLGKYLIFPSGVFVSFSRRYVICILIALFLSIYEWRMMENLFAKLINPFLGDSPYEAMIKLRGGWARITGPFTHPILFAIIVSSAIFLNYWLTRSHYWKRNISFLPPLFISKGTIISIFLFIGLLFTLSRGPLYTTLFAGMFIGLGYSKNKKTSFLIRLVLVLLLGFFTYEYYYAITTETPEGELSRSAIYRTNLFDAYKDIVYEKFWFGWGTIDWIKVRGMESIDNHYLLLALQHGMTAVAILVTLMLINMFRLFKQGMSVQTKNKSPLAFTLLSINLMISISVTTVFLGAQLEPLFFLLLGISESFLGIKNSEIDQYLLLKPIRQSALTDQEVI